MPEVTQQQVVDYIKNISVLELSQLVKALESELGVSAASAMPMFAGASRGCRSACRSVQFSNSYSLLNNSLTIKLVLTL